MIPERERLIQCLISYVSSCEPGADLGYVNVTKATGIQLRAPGECRMLSTAIRRAGRKSDLIKGYGHILSSADNASVLSGKKVKRVARAQRAAFDTASALLEQHGEKMTQHVKSTVAADMALVGAQMLATKGYRNTRDAAHKLAEKPPAPMLPKM